MKKLTAFFIVALFAFVLAACTETEPKEITCDEIIEVYEDAGYTVLHNHYDNSDEHDRWCSMNIEDPEKPDNNYMYINRYYTEEDAKAAKENDEYHIVIWLFAFPFGEHRWLKSGSYGTIQYSSYNSEMIELFEALTE